MAYPVTQVEDTDSITLLMEKDGTEKYIPKEKLSDLFVSGNDDLKRLRLHYLTIDETQKEDSEDVLEKAANIPSPGPSLLEQADVPPEAYTTRETVDPMGLYLKEMSRVPLLSTEEEVDLAQRIEAAEKADHKLAKLNGQTSKNAKEAYGILIEDGANARDHLIQANTRLVVSIAKKYLGRGVPFLDLIQEGNLGLMKAVKKYDYRRGFRFSTYAT